MVAPEIQEAFDYLWLAKIAIVTEKPYGSWVNEKGNVSSLSYLLSSLKIKKIKQNSD